MSRPEPDNRSFVIPQGKRRAAACLFLPGIFFCVSLCLPLEAQGQISDTAPDIGEPAEPSVAEGHDSGRSAGAFLYVEDVLRGPWKAVLQVLEGTSSDSLQNALNRLHEAKLDSGFPSSPRFAVLLLRQAYRFLDAGQAETARLLGETALDLAPHLASTHRFLALTAARSSARSFPETLRRKIACWKSQIMDFHWQYRTSGKVLLLLFGGLYVLLLLQGPYVLVRYGPMASHRLREGLRLEGASGTLLVAGVLLALVGALVLVGPFLTVVGLHLCLGPYTRRWEKGLFLTLLSVWIFSPWIARATARQLQPPPDVAAALYAVEKGEWDRTADEALRHALASRPESVDVLWAAALVEKRTGRYREAEAHLRRALELGPRNGALWNNLGNLLAFSGRTEEAKAAYERSIACAPGLAEPHYNLSQILRREFSFLKGASAFQEARRIDPVKTDSFVYIQSPHPNRFYMDVGPGTLRIWRLALSAPSDIRRSADDLWNLTGARISSRMSGLLTAVFLMAYGLFILSGRLSAGAYRCRTCGSIVCRDCQPIPSAQQTCNPCHQVLYQRSEIPREHRQKQLGRMARYGRRRGRAAFVANLFLPALGQAVLQDRPAEAVRFCLFALAVVLVAGWNAILPAPGWPWEHGRSVDWAWLTAWFLLLACYGLLQRRFLRRAPSGR